VPIPRRVEHLLPSIGHIIIFDLTTVVNCQFIFFLTDVADWVHMPDAWFFRKWLGRERFEGAGPSRDQA
jgi:hypothetical protein